MEQIKSVCGLCAYGCGILLQVSNGKATGIAGDPESPVNRGVLCRKGLASLEYLYHPDRLKYPLRRKGERGEGQWQRITWDEALDSVAGAMAGAKEKYGAESVALTMGSVKGIQDAAISRIASVFGTPNLASCGNTCYIPSMLSERLTCGFMPNPDYEAQPACIMVWGSNMAETRIGEHGRIVEALEKGARLIVIDPRKTQLAARANLWLRVRPGSDLALALGMINVIVNEGLFDKSFVDKWTIGFERLKEHIRGYSPQEIERITWVPAETIVAAARLYAGARPAVIPWGNAIEQNLNGFQTGRASAILKAITGNLDIPGGEIKQSPLDMPWWNDPEITLVLEMPKGQLEKRTDADQNRLPSFPRVSFESVKRAILQGKPYPIRMLYIQGSNVLLIHSNASETYRALKKVDFLAVAEMFMTPTAEMADILLPAAGYLEFDSISAPWYYSRAMAQAMQKVDQIGECRSDMDIFGGLASRLGLKKFFWGEHKSFLDYYLRRTGLTFEEFKKKGVLLGGRQYKKYEKDGFLTPSHKVEIYSERLQKWGFDPLPAYHEPPETPFSNLELAGEYPLVLTSFKREQFRHSGGRQIPTLRQMSPEPVTYIHPETAGKLGITEGDWVYIETGRGRIKQKASLTDAIDPRVVIVDFGWWFPEKGATEIHGWTEANINMLTDDKEPLGPELGTPGLRGILCKVHRA